MDELPVELIINIFKYLNIKQVFRLRSLSKKYKFIIDNLIEYKELIISKYESLFSSFKSEWIEKRWFISNELMNLNNFILFKKLNNQHLNLILNNQKFNNIQKLYIQITSEKLSFLSRFNKLDCLHIILLDQEMTIKKSSLIIENKNLTKLKIYIENDDFQYEVLISTNIDCPKLKYLGSNRFKNFHIIYPDSVIYLKSRFFYSTMKILEKFSNLEILEINHFNVLSPLTENLDFFEKIKRLNKIKRIILYDIFDHETNEFINYYLQLDLKNKIEIYYNGLLIKENIDYNYLGTSCLRNHNLSIFLDNYSFLLDFLPEISRLDYSAYESKLLENRIPDCFPNKLINLDEIKISEAIVNLNKFFEFVFSLNRIYKLLIDNGPLLTNDFYSNLDRYLPQLISLEIENKNELNMNNLDLNFLFKLRYLKKFKIKKELELNFIRDLFVNLNYLERLIFKFKDNRNFTLEANIENDSFPRLSDLIFKKKRVKKIRICHEHRDSNNKLDFYYDYDFNLDPKKIYNKFNKIFGNYYEDIFISNANNESSSDDNE